MLKRWVNDIRVIRQRDPACRNWFEAIICYPGYRAIRTYRWANFYWRHGLKLLARLISAWSHFWTGIDIHPGATIGEGLFIDHGTGVVIGETTQIGNNCTIYQGVTLGGTGKETGKRHPTIGSGVMIASGAKVLGPFTVGDHAKIGAGSVVLNEVPPYCTVVGIPGRVVRRYKCPGMNNEGKLTCMERPDEVPACIDSPGCLHRATDGGSVQSTEIDLDQVHIPDPLLLELHSLERRIEELEKRLNSDM